MEKSVMKVRPDTAAAIMSTDIFTIESGKTISYLKKILSKKARRFETINYVYVIDKKGVLKGVISFKELFQCEKDCKIDRIMKRDIVIVHPSTDQERVVYVALKHGLKVVPVVDKENHFLGAVTYNTILRIFNKEVKEDIFHFGGIYHKLIKDDVYKTSSSTITKSRIPWLIIGLLGGIFAAYVVGFFESTLNTYIYLAMFMPVLVYLTDAVGTQSETLIVRSLATNPKLLIRDYILRETKIGFSLASICSIMLSIAFLFGWGSPLLGIIIGISLFLSIFFVVIFATILPLIFKKLNIDPAIASGPFATIISDIITLAIYFIIASLLISLFA